MEVGKEYLAVCRELSALIDCFIQIHTISTRRRFQLWSKTESYSDGGNAEGPYGASKIQVTIQNLFMANRRFRNIFPYSTLIVIVFLIIQN